MTNQETWNERSRIKFELIESGQREISGKELSHMVGLRRNAAMPKKVLGL